MAFTSGFLTSSFGTVTVRTPFSIEAFTLSTFAFSGNLNLLKNFPLLRSTRCHLSFLSSFSTFLSPLIWRTLSSSISTFTSSFFSPGMSALNTCSSGVSFQSTRVLTNAEFSRPDSGKEEERELGKGKSLKGSHTSREKGSKTLLLRPPNKLGISDRLITLSTEIWNFAGYNVILPGNSFLVWWMIPWNWWSIYRKWKDNLGCSRIFCSLDSYHTPNFCNHCAQPRRFQSFFLYIYFC